MINLQFGRKYPTTPLSIYTQLLPLKASKISKTNSKSSAPHSFQNRQLMCLFHLYHSQNKKLKRIIWEAVTHIRLVNRYRVSGCCGITHKALTILHITCHFILSQLCTAFLQYYCFPMASKYSCIVIPNLDCDPTKPKSWCTILLSWISNMILEYLTVR